MYSVAAQTEFRTQVIGWRSSIPAHVINTSSLHVAALLGEIVAWGLAVCEKLEQPVRMGKSTKAGRPLLQMLTTNGCFCGLLEPRSPLVDVTARPQRGRIGDRFSVSASA